MLDDHWPGVVTVTSYYTRNIDAAFKVPFKIGQSGVVLGREFEYVHKTLSHTHVLQRRNKKDVAYYPNKVACAQFFD